MEYPGTVATLRLLHIVTDRDRRGAQVFATDLADGLNALGTENDVMALAPGVHGDSLQIECLGPTRRSWRTLRSLREHASSVDVVIAHGSSTLFVASIALFGSGVPFVYRQISDPLHWAANWPRRLRVAAFLRRSSAIVALSDAAADALQQHYRLTRRKLVVIPNAVPETRFTCPTSDEIAEARRTLGMPPDGPLAVYLGALSPEKGVDMAVRSTGAIVELRLLIVGDGPERGALEQLAAKVAPARVFFTGPIDGPATALRAADLVLLPSRSEAMPAVLIEAGLTSVTCVTTPVGSITDVVIDRVTGRIVPVDDQEALTTTVQELLDNPAHRRMYGAAAREHCQQHFTVSSTAPAWKALLSDVAAKGKRTDRRVSNTLNVTD